MIKTIKNVTDIILSLEKKYDLNHMKIQDTYPWQLIRMYIYYEIARKIGIFGLAQQGKVNLKDKIFSFIPFIKNSLFSNPLKGKYHKDILIFDHPRKTFHKNEFKDIYSYFLIEFLQNHNSLNQNYSSLKNIKNNGLNENFNFEVVESPYLNKHYSKKENYIKYNDNIFLGSYFNKKISNFKFNQYEEEKIFKIEEDIKNLFNINIDLLYIIKNHIIDFKYQYKKYDKLFKKRRNKYVFIVVAYENPAIVAAAKDNHVEVIELQHGVISKYHLGYHYLDEDKNNIDYFPDKILMFGDYWKKIANYPISEKNLISMGFPYLEENILLLENIEKTKNQILFISQGVIGKYLSKFAYEIGKKLEELNEEYEIIYKLHPGEYSSWQENYEYLKKAEELKNFNIIDNSEISLYELFAKSEYQVGVFSTAIYEGLLFKCKTLLVDLPGTEYLDDLIDNNFAIKIKNADDFIDQLQNFNINNYNKEIFFKTYQDSNLNYILDIKENKQE